MYLDTIHVIDHALLLKCEGYDMLGQDALLDFMDDAVGLLGYTPAELARGTSR
jgi:hypothetical protein